MAVRRHQELPELDALRRRIEFDFERGEIRLADQRMVLMHAEAIGSLRQELIETLGRERARGVITRMGYASGIRDARFARALHPEASDADVYLLGPHFHTLEGIVKVRPVRVEMDCRERTCHGEFIWENSVEAFTHRQAFGTDTEPACWMLIGYASGYTSELLGEFVLYKETKCAAMGDPHCYIVGRPAGEWIDAEEQLRYFHPDSVADRLLELQGQIQHLRSQLQDDDTGHAEVIGEAPSFRQALEMLDKVALSDVTVMLLGETGAGKEVLARRLHQHSARARAPFVAVNCAAIPEELIESELFGVEKGAFTGASRSRPGRFERAHGGTLFLDEVGDLSPAAQAKLLRAVQEGEIERVGDTRSRRVDVRLVVATNVDLREAVAEGRFRPDLYFRLNVYPVLVPPLRERIDDVPLLAAHFLALFAVRHGKRVRGFTEAALLALRRYGWPGNVRELANMIERGVLLAPSDGDIDVEHLFTPLQQTPAAAVGAAAGEDLVEALVDQLAGRGVSLEAFEQRVLCRAVQACGGNLSKAARLLGMTRPQIAYRLKKAGR